MDYESEKTKKNKNMDRRKANRLLKWTTSQKKRKKKEQKHGQSQSKQVIEMDYESEKTKEKEQKHRQKKSKQVIEMDYESEETKESDSEESEESEPQQSEEESRKEEGEKRQPEERAPGRKAKTTASASHHLSRKCVVGHHCNYEGPNLKRHLKNVHVAKQHIHDSQVDKYFAMGLQGQRKRGPSVKTKGRKKTKGR